MSLFFNLEVILENSKWLEFSPLKNSDGENIIFTSFVLINKNGKHESKALPLENELIQEFEQAILDVNR